MNTNTKVTRRFTKVLAAALVAGSMLGAARTASALTYVNLVTGEEIRGGDGPVSVSYGASSGNPQRLAEPMPETRETIAARLSQYRDTVLSVLQQAQVTVNAQVASLDGAIHEQHVAREMARSNYYALRTQESANRFTAAHNEICRLQTQRYNLLMSYFQTAIAGMNDLAQRDPTNASFYNYYAGLNNNLMSQAAAAARANYGLPQ